MLERVLSTSMFDVVSKGDRESPTRTITYPIGAMHFRSRWILHLPFALLALGEASSIGWNVLS